MMSASHDGCLIADLMIGALAKTPLLLTSTSSVYDNSGHEEESESRETGERYPSASRCFIVSRCLSGILELMISLWFVMTDARAFPSSGSGLRDYGDSDTRSWHHACSFWLSVRIFRLRRSIFPLEPRFGQRPRPRLRVRPRALGRFWVPACLCLLSLGITTERVVRCLVRLRLSGIPFFCSYGPARRC